MTAGEPTLTDVIVAMNAGFAQVDARFEQVDARIDTGFAQVEARFEQVDARFDGVDFAIKQLHADVVASKVDTATCEALIADLQEAHKRHTGPEGSHHDHREAA